MSAFYSFEDLSGSSTPRTSENPFQDLIEYCNNDAIQIEARYSKHRANRNAQQRTRILSPEFSGVTIDEILRKLEDPSIEPGFRDWRNCLVLWARPPQKVRLLIADIQQRLRLVVPNIWTMPPSNLHMTALEITHSLKEEQIDELVGVMLPSIKEIVDYTFNHRARLIRPMLSYDAQALALSFLPAVGEAGRSLHEDQYTYHHLRRDLFTKTTATGIVVGSRYVIPSAHLTIARFTTTIDHETDAKVDCVKVRAMIEKIDEINQWLMDEFWPRAESIPSGGEWIVGEEKGLEYRKGTLWYGDGGETVQLGQGF